MCIYKLYHPDQSWLQKHQVFNTPVFSDRHAPKALVPLFPLLILTSYLYLHPTPVPNQRFPLGGLYYSLGSHTSHLPTAQIRLAL